MKKSLISTLVVLSLFITPSFVVRAQTFSAEQQEQIRAINQQIQDLTIQILLARIAELQTQIAELIAQQATQATQLGAVSQKVDTVITNTTPIPVVVPPPLPPPPPPTPLTFLAQAPLSDYCMIPGQGHGSQSNEYDFLIGQINVVGLTATGTTQYDDGKLTARWESGSPYILVSSYSHLVTVNQFNERIQTDGGRLHSYIFARAQDITEPGTFSVTIQEWKADNGRQVSGFPIILTRTAKWCQ